MNKISSFSNELGGGIDINWEECVADYESTLRNAIRDAFPKVELLGCHFHFTQCIFGYIKRNSFLFKIFKVKHSIFRKFAHDLMAFSIVPKDKLITVFNVLLEGYKSKFPYPSDTPIRGLFSETMASGFYYR